MVFQQHIRKTTAILGLFGLLVILPGCPLSPDSDDGGPPVDTRLPERNSIENTIERQSLIWRQKKLREYEEILHDQFVFYVRDDDAAQLPWVENGFWERTIELEIASNMFDANFSGAEQPVDSIEYSYNTLNERPLTDSQGNVIGATVTVDAVVQILVGPDTGWVADTRLEFDVVQDPNEPGLYQIIRQQEFDV